MKKSLNIIFIALLLSSCIGTDILDDEQVERKIALSVQEQSLLLGDELQLSAKYYNEFGIETEANFDWQSDNTNVAVISSSGLLTTVGPGQAIITASASQTVSNMTLITVVGSVDDIASIIIDNPTNNILSVGEMLQLSAKAFNINNDELEGKVINWTSSDDEVATVDNTGLVSSLKNGTVEITASSEGIESQSVKLEIGSPERTGTFMGANGYNAEGMATLKNNEDGELILEFSADFKTSFALGTFIYLSNSTSGATTKSNGLELQEITNNGAKIFNISSLSSSADINTYRYVIVLCKPASITFGVADFGN